MAKKDRGLGQGQKGSGTYTGARKLGKEDIGDAVVKRGGGGAAQDRSTGIGKKSGK